MYFHHSGGLLFVSVRAKTRYVLFLFFFYFCSYFLIQSESAITSPDHDFLTAVDQLIPFVPEFIWIYHTMVPVFLITTILLIKRKNVFYTAFLSILLATVVMNLFYVYLPVSYPREIWQPADMSVSSVFVELTRQIDGSNNAFPSGHVTLSWLLTLLVGLTSFAKKHKWIQRFYVLWAFLISISTLTLKQHFMVDVFSGVILAILCYFLVKRFILKRVVN